MSKENVLRFMMIKDKDEAIKSAFYSIVAKHEGKDISKDEWEKVTQEDVIPLAKLHGFDFTLEELTELQKPVEGELSDEDLGEVTGGRGQMTISHRNRYRYTMTYTVYCDYAPDDEKFDMRYYQNSTDCPNYVWSGSGNPDRVCIRCANYRFALQ